MIRQEKATKLSGRSSVPAPFCTVQQIILLNLWSICDFLGCESDQLTHATIYVGTWSPVSVDSDNNVALDVYEPHISCTIDWLNKTGLMRKNSWPLYYVLKRPDIQAIESHINFLMYKQRHSQIQYHLHSDANEWSVYHLGLRRFMYMIIFNVINFMLKSQSKKFWTIEESEITDGICDQ